MKKHTFKKALALLLVLMMVVPAMPVIAADATETTTEYTYMSYPVTPEEGYTWLAEAGTGKTLYIDDAYDLACFMALGAVDPNNIEGSEALDVCNTIRLMGYTIELTADIVWNYGEIKDGAFVPDTAKQPKDAETGNTVIYTWTPYYSNTVYTSLFFGFRGTFNGNGHKISGLYISGTDNLGFFKQTGRGAKIMDVSFENTYVSGNNYVSALVAQSKDSLTISNVDVNGYVSGIGCVGGLIAMAADENKSEPGGYNITIENCTVSGSIKNTGWRTGGFIGMNKLFTVSISDSICYADINGSQYVGGFVGVGTADLTFNKCYFLGTIVYKNSDAFSGAFAYLWRTYRIGNALTADDGTATVTLTDCYYAEDSTTYALGLNKATPWYDVTVSYDEGTPTTTKCVDNVNTSGTNGAANKVASTGLDKSAIALPTMTTEVVDVEGVQMKDNGDGTIAARFVSSITLSDTVTKQSIKYMGFEFAHLGDFAKRGTAAQTPVNCSTVYASIKSNYGLEELTAVDDFGANYLAVMVVPNVPADATYTLLVRCYYTDTSNQTYYSSYAAVTFINGRIAGCTTIGE